MLTDILKHSQTQLPISEGIQFLILKTTCIQNLDFSWGLSILKQFVVSSIDCQHYCSLIFLALWITPYLISSVQIFYFQTFILPFRLQFLYSKNLFPEGRTHHFQISHMFIYNMLTH